MRSPLSERPVVVTGLTGFIGSRIAIDLLRRGYSVRGTVRDLDRADEITDLIAAHAPVELLTVVAADLMHDAGWTEAMQGADYAMHVASPVALQEPSDPNELIRPAVEGTLRVLRAAAAAGLKRVVLTSSIAAVAYGLKRGQNRPMDESRWTDLDATEDLTAYSVSKTLAERAAWKFIDSTPGAPELVTVNPGMVFGPVLDKSVRSPSTQVITRFLKGQLPGTPKIHFEAVDVRDVSDLHLRALEMPEAAGQRYLATGGVLTLAEVGELLGQRFPRFRRKMPKFESADWLTRIGARFDQEVSGVINELGRQRLVSSQKARTQLGWRPRSPHEAVVATAADLIRLRIV